MLKVVLKLLEVIQERFNVTFAYSSDILNTLINYYLKHLEFALKFTTMIM